MTINEQIAAHLNQLYDPDGAQEWLASPQKLLDGAIPAQLIERGEGQRVLDLLEEIASGAYL